LRRIIVITVTCGFLGLLIIFSIPLSTYVSADTPGTTTTIAVDPVTTTTTVEPKPKPKPGPSTTQAPTTLPTPTVAPTTTHVAPTTTQGTPTPTTTRSPTSTTVAGVTIPSDGSVVQLVTTTTIDRSFDQASTTVRKIVRGSTVITEPTTTVAGQVTVALTSTSSPATTVVDVTTNGTTSQQLVAPTITTVVPAGLLRSANIDPNQSKSPGIDIQGIFLVIIGAMTMGVAVFIILGERRLRR
jgi:hypothetical protein